MKNLVVVVILLLCALTTHAQNGRRATVQPDTFSHKVDLVNAPASKWDTLTLSLNASERRHKRRHAGIVCLIVGGGISAGGIALVATADNLTALLGGGLLIANGSTLAIIGGALMLSAIPPRNERYSIILRPNGLGLAYNF